MILFAKGLAFGFLLAATVGPMWILCLRRILAFGPGVGLASGLGIACADGLYGAVAAFGLTAVSGFLLGYSFWIGSAGAAFLAYLGIKALIAPAPSVEAEVQRQDLRTAFVSTLGLTLANPPTILTFAALFAGLGLGAAGNYAGAALVTLGVFLGSLSWWIVLAAAAGRLRARLGPRLLRGINVVSGISILGFAGWQVAELLR